ncbi:TRAP transporter small permease [Pararhodobacter sp.]|uniref:TRAP transporter small permease n=1 Tax=Pararhodobacter sp. TaxID=2127056 RepID=UPI002AFE594A|nr:TRAP transporter small permease [Pararhodobacter sp.]
MSRLLDRLQRLGIQISKPTAIIGVLGLLMIAIITILTVTARAVFNHPIVWGHDVASLIIIVVVATCFPTGVMLRKHVAIEFLGSALGPKGARVLDFFGALVTAFALTVLAWQMSVIADQETAYNSTTVVTRIPTGPVWWLASIIVWVSVPLQFVVTFQILTGKRRIEPKEDQL